MHGCGTAPTRGTSRPLRTPLPPQIPGLTPEEEARLTFKPSQRPWARLLWGPETSSFARMNRSVQIYAAQQIPVSPTHYPGQSTEWFHTDHDTLYRVMKRVKVRQVKVVETQASVPHTKLLPTLPSRNAPSTAIQCPRERYSMDPDTVVYTKEPIIIELEGVPMEVRRHTGVTLSKAVSRHQRPGDKIWNANPLQMHYIVQVYVDTYKWKWVECNKGITIGKLEQLTAAEIDTLNNKTLLRSKVVSADAQDWPLLQRHQCWILSRALILSCRDKSGMAPTAKRDMMRA
ncbi:hypothetical protein GSI_10302 [Ganoderma sinense ZZ0214-1]|uniref:Uncharacterized protein n=1 Tax=Ganoderma sinense ZZ0214-1 TaxID=1077348 RepID=A0A2G8S070_9APHY|nr:hypothetical protein GSI_10302 [Ganoderma sinense ZZ0214-1]